MAIHVTFLRVRLFFHNVNDELDRSPRHVIHKTSPLADLMTIAEENIA